MLERLSHLIQSRRGAAALEFAFVAPFFVLLMLGCLEIAATVRANTKAQTATDAFAQLIVSRSEITYSNFSDYCKIANHFFEALMEADDDSIVQIYRYTVLNGVITDGYIFANCSEKIMDGPSSKSYALSIAPNISGVGSQDGNIILVKTSFSHYSSLSEFLPKIFKIEASTVVRPRYGSLSGDSTLTSMVDFTSSTLGGTKGPTLGIMPPDKTLTVMPPAS